MTRPGRATAAATLVCCMSAALATSCRESTRYDATLRETAGGEPILTLRVGLAEDELARREGLRAYPPLVPGQGLLLLFPGTSEVWIDAIFVDARGDVIQIERAIPAHDERARCVPETRAVLEVLAGAAGGARPGDQLVVAGVLPI